MLASSLLFSLISLSALDLVSCAVLPIRSSTLQSRDLAKGWSLQETACPVYTNSCGGGSCCPLNLFCQPAALGEVAACCPTDAPCRESFLLRSLCADPTWTLWKGLDGNGFCCESGMIGVYDATNFVAGTCVASADTAGATAAVLITQGFEVDPVVVSIASLVDSAKTVVSQAAPTVAPIAPIAPQVDSITQAAASSTATPTGMGSKSSKMSSKASAPTTAPATAPGTAGKPVFFHYMVGGITEAHCEQDIIDAQNLGADAFALNVDTVTQSWATDTVTSLFKMANKHNFKLFFSFDMTGFSDPRQFTDFLNSYVTNPAHFRYKGLPFVSTFNGGSGRYTFGQGSVNDGWKVALQQTMANKGNPIYFIPAFQDVSPNNFFQTFPTVDGAFNWDSWAFQSQGKIAVPTDGDETYMNGAHAAGKTFMMGVSPLQFKHMDGGNNWYRRGEQGLELRFGQVLNMQPDFIELQTWNDAGESHYMGNSWPEPIQSSNIGAYTNDYDHTGYWEILPAFIKAYKSGATTTATMYPTNGQVAQGVFWHHTLLAGANCGDGMGKPNGADLIEDLVTVVVLVAAGTTDLRVDIKSGNNNLGGTTLVPGYNTFTADGLTTGTVTVVVSSAGGAVVRQASGPLSVANGGNLYNYNFQVVGL